MRFLLDTNVVSELARPAPDPTVAARVIGAQDVAALSAVTWHELHYGVDRLARGRRRDALAEFVSELRLRFAVLPYDAQAADHHARERARLEAAGVTRSFADGQIAAIAVTRGLTLVTRNVRDFAGYAGLDVATWWSRPN